MQETTELVQVWKVSEASYGRFNREVLAWVNGYGLTKSLVEDKDCSLAVGEYRREVVATVAEFGSGKKLISKI